MKIPDGYTEQQVIQIINNISNKIVNKFKFGYHEKDDMKQQVYIEVLKPDKAGKNILDKFDPKKGKPLESFLWIHIRNRLYNFKRNNYARPEKPCDACPLNAYVNKKCTAYTDELDCEHYFKWVGRNNTKKNLMSTKFYYDTTESDSLSVEETVFSKEIYSIVNSNIPLSLREDWLRFTNKLKLTKTKKENLIKNILIILKEHGIEP